MGDSVAAEFLFESLVRTVICVGKVVRACANHATAGVEVTDALRSRRLHQTHRTCSNLCKVRRASESSKARMFKVCVYRCTIESDFPNPDTAPRPPGSNGTSLEPLQDGPIVVPAPPSGVGVPGSSTRIPKLYIYLVLLTVVMGAACFWRWRRRRRARRVNRKRRRSEYTTRRPFRDESRDGSESSIDEGRDVRIRARWRQDTPPKRRRMDVPQRLAPVHAAQRVVKGAHMDLVDAAQGGVQRTSRRRKAASGPAKRRPHGAKRKARGRRSRPEQADPVVNL